MSVIRKKPYVEKVVESLSSESLELLRETLNTNKENVNCSLIGGNNLLKKFEKEYVGNLLTESTQVSSIYFNFRKYNTWEKVEKLSSSLAWLDFTASITSDDLTNSAQVVMIKGDINFGEFSKTRLLIIAPKIGDAFDITQAIDSWAFLGDEQEAKALAQAQGITNFEWQGEGWYGRDYKKIEDDIFVLDNIEAQTIGEVADEDKEAIKYFISFNTPFATINTQLIGHIPAVGDTIEKVYFNPNAYSTDEEWLLWYESLKQYKEDNEDLIGARLLKWAWDDGSTSDYDMVINGYNLAGVGTLTDILAFSILKNALLYVTSKALTGTYAQVYQQFGITTTGWYKVTISGGTPTGVTKLTSITELTHSPSKTYTVVESPEAYIEQSNYPLFAKAVSYNTPFVETPIQNNLKPASAKVGDTINKIYINLGYFNSDLNKMQNFLGGDSETRVKELFAYGDVTVEFEKILEDMNETFLTYSFDLGNHLFLIYVSQLLVSNGLVRDLTQDDVNKWVLVDTSTTPRIIEFVDTDVYEYEIEGTITELGDTSLISFNKPFTEISGYIYDEITPVNLQLEQNNLKTGILVWNDEYCTLLAYHRFEDMREYEIDYEKYSFKAINESLTINELRRVVFTPTQETSVISGDDLEYKTMAILTSSTNKKHGIYFASTTSTFKKLLKEINDYLLENNVITSRMANYQELYEKIKSLSLALATIKSLIHMLSVLMGSLYYNSNSKFYIIGCFDAQGNDSASFDSRGNILWLDDSDGYVLFYSSYYSSDHTVTDFLIINNATFIGLDVTEVADITE